MPERSLPVRQLRKLDLAEPTPHGAAFLSAASGLAIVGDHYLVIADDAHHIGLFPQRGGPGRLLRVVEGDLPSDPAERKRHKPDFEAVITLPPALTLPNGGVLLVGSGSTDRRERAALLPFDRTGLPRGDVVLLPLDPLLAPLREATGDDVNIEAGFLDGPDLVLISRGHAAKPANHIARFELTATARWLEGASHAPISARTVSAITVGAIDGIPLGITDAAALPGGSWMFSAVAEATADSYHDGALLGAALGIVSSSGEVQRAACIEPANKIEGIVAQLVEDSLSVLMVTDADDPTVPAALLAADFGTPSPDLT